ncbi:MAG: tryptophan synthase subunit alpha [Lachnospiraceae bacterium]|nr:tryptophan synthase subunit alpha [Lachnospiraceae bacterium]
MNRIEERLATLQAKKEKAFITYLTAGLPNMEATAAIVKAQEEAGTDIIEIGVPFSDPIADGPVIQQASYEAIQAGANLKKSFELIAGLRADGVKLPIVFMLYYNTVLHYGLENFVKKCQKIGVDGLIIPDLPLEEQGPIKQYLTGDETILIQLVSPVSAGRIGEIVKSARGFIYCVSSMGVTGQSGSFHKEILGYLSDVKKQSPVPVMMGFGITEAKDVALMKDVIDGAIVGSHFINLMREHQFDPQAAKEYCARFKKELNLM